MSKLFDTCTRTERDAKRNETRLDEDSLPKLWILSPTASQEFLSGFNTKPDVENWLPGIYFFGDSLRTVVVAIHQLPVTKETLWLRLLGKGRVQQKAIEEVQALDFNNPLRGKAIDLLANLKTTLELNQNLDTEDRNLVMQLSPIYEQRLAEARQIERRTIIENLLRVRFGALDEQLSTIVEPLLVLPPEEFTTLLVQLSREDLLRRFN